MTRVSCAGSFGSMRRGDPALLPLLSNNSLRAKSVQDQEEKSSITSYSRSDPSAGATQAWPSRREQAEGFRLQSSYRRLKMARPPTPLNPVAGSKPAPRLLPEPPRFRKQLRDLAWFVGRAMRAAPLPSLLLGAAALAAGLATPVQLWSTKRLVDSLAARPGGAAGKGSHGDHDFTSFGLSAVGRSGHCDARRADRGGGASRHARRPGRRVRCPLRRASAVVSVTCWLTPGEERPTAPKPLAEVKG